MQPCSTLAGRAAVAALDSSEKLQGTGGGIGILQSSSKIGCVSCSKNGQRTVQNCHTATSQNPAFRLEEGEVQKLAAALMLWVVCVSAHQRRVFAVTPCYQGAWVVERSNSNRLYRASREQSTPCVKS